MNRINSICVFVLGLMMSLPLSAQDVTLYYEVVSGIGSETVKLYLQNNTATNLDLGSANLSLTFNSSDVSLQSVSNSLFESSWGPGNNVQSMPNATFLPAFYGGNPFDLRLWYLASMPVGGAPITLTAGASPLLVMEVDFASGGANNYYPETVAEFLGNGMTTASLIPVSYDVQPLNAPFPVKWLEFEAYPIGPDKVQLDWITASEVNNAEFQIERSVDNLSFEMIGRVEGAGTSQTASVYQFQDGKAIHPVLYYRLRQVDFDGKFFYSSVREVKMAEEIGLSLSLFPNPAAEQVSLSINSDTERAFELRLTDSRGRLLSNEQITLGGRDHKIAVNELAEGVYSIMLIENKTGDTFSKMFIRQ